MKLYGYKLCEHYSKNNPKIIKLSESSVECSIDEFERLIELLNRKKEELIKWADNRDRSISIDADDYTDIEFSTEDKSANLYFLVSLKSVLDKYDEHKDK